MQFGREHFPNIPDEGTPLSQEQALRMQAAGAEFRRVDGSPDAWITRLALLRRCWGAKKVDSIHTLPKI